MVAAVGPSMFLSLYNFFTFYKSVQVFSGTISILFEPQAGQISHRPVELVVLLWN